MTRLVKVFSQMKKLYNVYSMNVLCRPTSLIVSERFKSVFELFWSLKGHKWSWNVQATNGCNAERSGKPWKVRACNAFNRLVELIILLLASLTAHHRLLPLKAILICDKRWETLMDADRIRWFYTFEFFFIKVKYEFEMLILAKKPLLIFPKKFNRPFFREIKFGKN